MRFFIPTYKRSEYIPTLSYWPADLPIALIVRPEEERAYRAYVKQFFASYQIAVIPAAVEAGISFVRNACITLAGNEKFMMFDDDLELLVRKHDHAWKLRGMEYGDVHEMAEEVEDALDRYAHVGISMREGNNRILDESVENARMIRATAYHGGVLQSAGLRFDRRFDTKEDLEFTLRLLSMGFANLVFYCFAQGQGKSDAPGGCNAQYDRTVEQMREKAQLLALTYPHCVKVTEKATIGAWGGGTRPEVRIYWKKAFQNRGFLTESEDEDE